MGVIKIKSCNNFFGEDWLMQEISMKQGMNMDQKRCET